MAVKVWIDGNVVYVDNGVATANPINLKTFFFEKDDDSQTVTLRDSNDGFILRTPSSDVQDQGGTPIGTFQDVVDFLESVVDAAAVVPLPTGAATEATLLDLLAAVDAMRDYEVRLVVDSLDVTWLEVRYWDAQDGTLGAPVYYPPGSTTAGTPTGALTYINPNTYLAQLVSNTTGLATELTLSGIKTQIDLLNFISTALEVNVTSSVLPTGAATEATLATLATEAKLEQVRALLATIDADTSNLDVALSTRATEATLELCRLLLVSLDGKDFATETSLGKIVPAVGTDGAVHGASQKGVRALGTDGTNDQKISTDVDGKVNVLVQNPSPIPVSGTVTVNQPVTVDSTDLDIRDLTHVSDSVKVGDGTDFMAVNDD
jgi:hypothetical protein